MHIELARLTYLFACSFDCIAHAKWIEIELHGSLRNKKYSRWNPEMKKERPYISHSNQESQLSLFRASSIGTKGEKYVFMLMHLLVQPLHTQ